MNRLLIVALVAGQIAGAAAPARGAELISAETTRDQHMGSFVGARFQVPLAGARRQMRATLTAAPMLHSSQPDGAMRSRVGQGFELGFVGARARVDLAGQPVSRLIQGPEAPGARRQNISTVGWVAIGVGIVALSAFLLYGMCGSGEICDTEDH